MKLNMTIDTEDFNGEDGIDFESLLSKEFKREIIKSCKSDLASDKFKEFSELVCDTILADIKLRIENFLSEEISLTEGWGKPVFVGSIEDLIKKRFDDILLRSVDSSGKTLKGCTSSGGDTWVEWKIGDILNNKVSGIVSNAARAIEKEVKSMVEEQIIDIKDNAIKQQVNKVFAEYVSKDKS